MKTFAGSDCAGTGEPVRLRESALRSSMPVSQRSPGPKQQLGMFSTTARKRVLSALTLSGPAQATTRWSRFVRNLAALLSDIGLPPGGAVDWEPTQARPEAPVTKGRCAFRYVTLWAVCFVSFLSRTEKENLLFSLRASSEVLVSVWPEALDVNLVFSNQFPESAPVLFGRPSCFADTSGM